MAPAAPSATEALLQALGGRPGASAADLAAGAGIGRSTANKLLVKLAAEGRVVREAGGRRDDRRRPDRWTLLAPAPAQPAKDPNLPSHGAGPLGRRRHQRPSCLGQPGRSRPDPGQP